jgi:hypothetical protein
VRGVWRLSGQHLLEPAFWFAVPEFGRGAGQRVLGRRWEGMRGSGCALARAGGRCARRERRPSAACARRWRKSAARARRRAGVGARVCLGRCAAPMLPSGCASSPELPVAARPERAGFSRALPPGGLVPDDRAQRWGRGAQRPGPLEQVKISFDAPSWLVARIEAARALSRWRPDGSVRQCCAHVL